MNDVITLLTRYVSEIKATQPPQLILANIRSFTQLLQSSSLQPIVAALKEQKYNDLAGFQKAFTVFHCDKKNALLLIQEFVNKTPFLQKHLPGELFAQNIPQWFIFLEPFVKLNT